MSDAERLEQLERRLAQLEEQVRVLAAGKRGSGEAGTHFCSRQHPIFGKQLLPNRPASPLPRLRPRFPASPLPRFHPSSGSANASSWP